MNKTRLRAAIIGCGAIAKTHAAALSEADYAELVALCDIQPGRAEALAETFAKGARTFSDWRQMLDEVTPDVVHVCTPHDLHKEMACECLARGIHVYLEKPATITGEELDALMTAEAASTARITVSFQNRRTAANRLFYHLIEEEGGAVAARAMVTWHRGERYYTADDWHGRLAREGGGAMINQAIHTLDLLLNAFPAPIASVQGEIANWENTAFSEVEDNAAFLVNLADGGKICFYATNDYGTDAPNFYEVATRSGVRITGMDGHIYKNGVRMDTEEVLVPLVGKSCWGHGHAIAIREFYEAVVTGGPVPIPLASAARVMRVLFALYRSRGAKILLTDD